MIERENYISILEKWKDKQVIKIITGIRRCGKSTVLKMYREKLISTGTDESQIIYLNFEDLENEQYLDYRSLYDYVKPRLNPGKMNYSSSGIFKRQ